MRLFCFHHAGGGSALYRNWQVALGPSVDVQPVVLPGHEDRWGRSRFTAIEPLVAYLDDQLEATAPHVFFGHSMGALVAYRLAILRRDRGRPLPRRLALSGYAPPHLPPPLPPVDDLDALAPLLTQIGGLPTEIHGWQSLLSDVLTVARDDLSICASAYTPSIRALDVPILALGGDADPIVGERDLAAWADYTTSSFSLTVLPGDHFYLTPPPEELFAVIRGVCRQS